VTPVDTAQIEVIDDLTAEIVRRMTPAQKMAMVDQLVRFGRGLMAAGVRADHPGWSANQIDREVARRLMRGGL
jgi:hypothetical protein